MSFNFNALRQSGRIVGASTIAFFVFLFFFHWYGGSSNTSLGGVSAGANGWHTFTNSRWVWLITIVVALVAVAAWVGAISVDRSIPLGTIVAGLGGLSSLLILYRIIHHPHGSVSATIAGVHYSASYGIKIGIWLGLIAALGITYGGYMASKDGGTSLAGDDGSDTLGDTAGQGPPPGVGTPPAAGGPAAPGAPASTPSTSSPAGEGEAPPIPPPAGTAPATAPPAASPPGSGDASPER
jgi:hypothetical protein